MSFTSFLFYSGYPNTAIIQRSLRPEIPFLVEPLDEEQSEETHCGKSKTQLYHIIRNRRWGAILKWQKNRMGRPLSPPQLNGKIIWMLSKYHKTTSEHWQRTPGTQKGSPLSSKGDKKRGKRGMEICPRKRVIIRRSFQKQGNPHTSRSVGIFAVSEDKITRTNK